MSSIDTVVNKNPRQVWMVNAVPMYCGSPSSVIQVENWAESATTLAPQTAAITSNQTGCAPNRAPTIRQQLPLIAMAHDVTVVLPMRSASNPADTQPMAPHPITKNDASSATELILSSAPRLALIITGAHAHIA